MPGTMEEYSVNKPQFKQDNLTSKLQERLGYSGIYSQRDSEHFFEQLSWEEQQKLLQDLKIAYYQIISDYFSNKNVTNNQIDRFVEKAFFINLPLDKVVEIHMELIDNLYRKLQLEGRHAEFLSDYRLALIDVIAHLGEMYRSVITENCVVSS